MGAAARTCGGALLLPVLLLLAAPLRAAPDARPAPGRHAVELCVATGAAAPSCGPAQVDLGRDGALRLRIDDVVYHLQLRSSQVEVVLTHGAVQIDEFTVPYAWAGSALTFVDDERSARYEIRFPETRPAVVKR